MSSARTLISSAVGRATFPTIGSSLSTSKADICWSALEFETELFLNSTLESTTVVIVFTAAFVDSIVFFLYLIVRVVLTGTIPNFSVFKICDGSKLLSEKKSPSFYFNAAAVGSGNDLFSISVSEPKPN